jgi:hypothetical protein
MLRPGVMRGKQLVVVGHCTQTARLRHTYIAGTAVWGLLLVGPNAALAQSHEQQEVGAEETDLGDVWRKVRGKPPSPTQPSNEEARRPMITWAPTIGANPSSGLTFGAAAQLAIFLGDPATTRISSGIASVAFSTKKQGLLNVRFGAFSNENRWLVEGDNRFHVTSQNVYGLGTDTQPSAAVETDYNFVRVHETVYRQIYTDVLVGAGLMFDSHTRVHVADDPASAPSEYVAYSNAHGLPIDSQQSGGLRVGLRVTKRDAEINARRGWMADASYRMSFDGFLGGDSSWQLLHLEFRDYVPLAASSAQRLAFWGFSDLTVNGAPPYFDLPATVMDTYGRAARGYREGRYRGERLAYGEIEYRGAVTHSGLIGIVAFANTTTVSNLQTGEHLFDSFAPAVGGGLRLLLNKRSRTNLCFDVAWGKDNSHGVYFALQDAF